VPIVGSMATTTTAAKPIVPPPRVSRLGALWSSLVGKKALMAASGIVLFAFVVGHMVGNLQAFEGAERLNAYARFLRVEPPLLWTVRIVILVAALVHAIAGIQLWLARRSARPVAYRQYQPSASTPASRTMIWSGFLILGFAVYHLLDLTFGVANPSFVEGDVFHNLVASLGRAAAAVFYVLAVAGLGVHLWHGLWSMFQSLGVSNRAYTPGIKRFAVAFAVLLGVGFAAIPLAVLLGVIGG
jgi:succinate dehydrogenase / fumarate reductase cytochrome b subunit